MSKVLSAVAWPYANGPRHIGHVAGFGVPSDVFSRYMRMAGHDVLMVSGTDEHGTPILVAADEAGVTARELADTQQPDDRRGPASPSGCPTTCSPAPRPRNHYAVVQEMFRTVHRNGYMVEQTTQGRDLARRPGAPCPTATSRAPARSAATTSARGDQCDNCGNQLDPTDLIDPRSKINGEVPEFVETQHFFLDLPALADALKAWLDEREASGHLAAQRHQVQPEHPRGHPAAGDDPRHRLGHPGPARRLAATSPTKRLYVWFDAVIGYLSASIEWARRARRARPLARLVERPRGAVLLLHGQGQHHLPLPDLARRAPRVRRPGRPGRRAGGVRRR